jgi:hypothetical protein
MKKKKKKKGWEREEVAGRFFRVKTGSWMGPPQGSYIDRAHPWSPFDLRRAHS